MVVLKCFNNCFIRYKRCPKINLNHVLKESVDLVLSVAEVAALHVVNHLLAPSALRVVQLEVPQEVAGVLEVGTHCIDLVDQVLHTDDALFAQSLLNNRVVGQRNPLSLQFTETSFVDQFSDCLKGGITPRDERFGDSQHIDSGFIEPHEDAIVDLTKTQQLQHFPRLRADSVDTKGRRHEVRHSETTAADIPSDSDDKSEFGFCRNVKVAMLFGLALQSNHVPLILSVLLYILFCSLEDHLLLCFADLPVFEGLLELSCLLKCFLFPLLKDGLGHCRHFVSGRSLRCALTVGSDIRLVSRLNVIKAETETTCLCVSANVDHHMVWPRRRTPDCHPGL